MVKTPTLFMCLFSSAKSETTTKRKKLNKHIQYEKQNKAISISYLISKLETRQQSRRNKKKKDFIHLSRIRLIYQ
jgi:hypothetical protein